MNALFEIAAFLLLFYSTASLLLQQPLIVRAALSLAISFVLISLAALGLIAVNVFSPGILLGVCVLVSAGLYFAAVKIQKRNTLNIFTGFKSMDVVDILAVVFCLGVLVLNFRYSTEVVAGRDMGVYTQEAIVFSRTGGMNFDIPDNNKLEGISGDFYEFGYPGFYSDYIKGTSDNPASITPQFALLFPALLAVSYSAFGVTGLFTTNALLGSLALLCFYLFVKSKAGRWPALAAVISLGTAAAQYWNSRVTLTEIFFQMVLFAALVIFEIGFKQDKKSYLALAGALLGLTVFIRIDCMLLFPAVAAYVLYLFLVRSQKFQSTLPAFWTFVLAAAAGLIFGNLTSSFYVEGLWNYGLKSIVILGSALAILVLLAQVIDLRFPAVRAKISFAEPDQKTWRVLAFVISGLLIIIGIYFYFIRPVLFTNGALANVTTLFQAQAFKELTWYIPVWLVILSVFSTGVIVNHKNREADFLFLLIAYSFIALYIYNPSIYPDHFWASRRWIPVTIPAMIAMAYWGVGLVLGDRKKLQYAVLGVIALPSLIFNYIQSDLIFHNPMYNDLYAEIETVVANFPADGQPIFTNNEEIASAVRYIYGRNIFLVNGNLNTSAELADIGKEFGTFYFLGDFDYLTQLSNPQVVETKTLLLSTHFPERSVNAYPSRIDENTFNFSLYKLVYDPARETGDSAFFNIGNSESEALTLVNGFGAAETSSGGTDFRWTGADAELSLGMPVAEFLDRDLDIRIRMMHFVNGADAVITINGTPFPVGNISSEFAYYTIHIPAEVVDHRETMSIAFSSPTSSPFDLGISQDTRQLGLCVDLILLEAVGE